jgi:superfamily II DNA/RNA helicase
MPQPKRTETLDRFRNGEIRLLVASDVAARGLDIKGMSHVFCFDVPIHAEDYVHRIGRTGRAGLEGRSFMLAAPEDGDAVAAIVKLIGREIPPIAIEGIEAAELEYGGRRARRGARRPAKSDRLKSDRHRTRTDAAPRREPAEPRAPRRERRPSAKEAAQQDLPASNVTLFPRTPVARVSRRPERQPEPDRQVVGFGDHLPAFLARPPRIVARP